MNNLKIYSNNNNIQTLKQSIMKTWVRYAIAIIESILFVLICGYICYHVNISEAANWVKIVSTTILPLLAIFGIYSSYNDNILRGPKMIRYNSKTKLSNKQKRKAIELAMNLLIEHKIKCSSLKKMPILRLWGVEILNLHILLSLVIKYRFNILFDEDKDDYYVFISQLIPEVSAFCGLSHTKTSYNYAIRYCKELLEKIPDDAI